MKHKIKIFLAVSLLLSSIASVVYACVPSYSLVADYLNGCPGIFKRSQYTITVSSGSQGTIYTTMYTNGNGGCGYQTICEGAFDSWKECWPLFYTPTVSSGCWRQTVFNQTSNCTSVSCGPTGTRQTCSCEVSSSTVFSVGVGPAYCGGCS